MGCLKGVPWVVYVGVLLIGISIWARDVRGSYVGIILIVVGFAQSARAAQRAHAGHLAAWAILTLFVLPAVMVVSLVAVVLGSYT